ncbi:hypothetical protein FACS189454_02240 [Planctomycetales bacterium]|nr:hypothetical protein FACS189454_02240 [Planctomycetales bacterium]
MAKRPAEDEEDDAPKIKKRRRPKKTTDDEEEGAGRPPSRGRKDDDDDEEDENLLPSTGIVLLDIVLDFRDDCLDWANEHFLYALIICVVAFIIFSVVSSLIIHSWVRYLNRPSLQSVLKTYDIGAYADAKLYADEGLRYAAQTDYLTRAGFLFIQGAANVAIGDAVPEIDKRPYYLTAANYLEESSQYDFVEGRASEGWFLYGKALFLADEFVECREPLETALGMNSVYRKMIFWYLANAYLFGADADLNLSRQYLERFQNMPTVLEEEIAEAHLLSAMIELQQGDIEGGEKEFALVPRFQRFTAVRHLVEGEIDFLNARRLAHIADEIETNPNPMPPDQLPPAPTALPPVPKLEIDNNNSNESQIKDVTPPAAVPPAPVSKINNVKTDNRNADHFNPESLNPAYPFAETPVVGIDSSYSRQIAGMQPKYAEEKTGDNSTADINNAANNKIIVLPNEKKAPAAPQPEKLDKPLPVYVDLTKERIEQFRDAARKRYLSAIEHFGEVIRRGSVGARWGQTAMLLTGLCYEDMHDYEQAFAFYQNLIDSYPAAPDTAAASFRLAQYDRQRGKYETAGQALARTFGILRKTKGYSNPWIPKDEMIAAVLEFIRTDITSGQFADAVKLLGTVRGVMPPTDETRLRGETYEEWAADLHNRSLNVFGEQGENLANEALKKMRLAGQAFDDYAEVTAGTPLYADNLWRSAENYRTGKDYRKAVLEYRKYEKASYNGHRPEVYLYLGEMYLNIDALTASAAMLEDAIKDYPADKLTPALRLVLSRTYCEQNKTAEAKTLLQQNLASDFTPESAIYRDSLYALGQLCFQRQEYAEAEAYLSDAVKIHPQAVQVADGYYTLAICCQRRADNELAQLDATATDAMRVIAENGAAVFRQQALTHLQSASAILTARQKGLTLTDSETLMLRNVLFGIGSLLIKMNRFEEAAAVLNQTATRYQDRPEALDALVSLAFALRKSGRKDEALAILNRAEVLLKRLTQSGAMNDGGKWQTLIAEERKK